MLLLLPLLVLTAQPASQASSQPVEPGGFLSDAPLFTDKVDVAKLKRYLSARPSSPLAPRARLLIGLEQLRAGAFEEAAQYLQIARKELPEIADVVTRRLADAFYGAGKLDACRKALEMILDYYAEDGTALYEDTQTMLATVLWKQGQRQKAADLAAELIGGTADEQRLVKLLMLQASWEQQLGDKREAYFAYKRVWISYPHFPESEQAREQATLLAKALGITGELTVEEKLQRARELARLGRDEDGESLILSVIADNKREITPERRSGLLLRRASSALRRKYPEIAVELCTQLLKSAHAQKSKDFRHDVLRVLGKGYSQLQRYKEAAEIQKTLAAESRTPKLKKEAALLYAVLTRDSGDVREAQKLFQKFIDENGNDPKGNDARWFLGWSHYRLGEAEPAFKQWRTVLEKASSSQLVPRIQYWIARWRDGHGDTAGAQRLYQIVRDDDPWSYYGWLADERLAIIGKTASVPTEADRKRVFAAPPVAPLMLSPGNLPNHQKAFGRSMLFWQVGLVDEAARSLREVPVPEDPEDALLLAQLHDRLEDHFRGFVIAKTRFSRFLKEPLPLDDSAGTDQRAVLELAYPRAYRRHVDGAAQRFNVPSELVYAVMRQESTFKQEARSWADAQGLLQLIPKTAQRIATEIGEPPPSSFVAPEVNIRLGTAYLSRLFGTFDGHPALAAAAYNAGPNSVDQWLLRLRELPFDMFVEEIPFRETRDYTKKVLANFAAYRRIYLQARTPILGILEPLPTASKGIIDY